MSTTKDRIIETSAELFRRQGYSATGVKQIVTAAKAPFGSLYHFFPGGKEELGAATVRTSGALYGELVPAIFDPAPDVVTAVRNFFNGAADALEESDYEEGCPIATVALEAVSTSETLREACAEVFESWIALGTERFRRAGLDPTTARELAVGFLAALEGAFVLSQAAGSTEPMRVAGELVAQRVERALTEPAAERAAARPTAARVRPRLRARWPDPEEPRSPGPALP
ncbi:MAG TPA: TetR/AcrR family transcriptional regulator [Solirubrobacteraceae bacterium]|nr:TetR/AcrR family transcriptional regulator [Solirubrobacteraceae bacterium]